MDTQTLKHKTVYKKTGGCYLNNNLLCVCACIVYNHSQAEQLSQGKCFLLIIVKAKNPVSFPTGK